MITVVTDTSVGYSRAEAQSRGIRLVSLAYSIGGIPYVERPRGENCGYAERMQAGKPVKTRQPSPRAFTELFGELTSGGGEVLCVTHAGALGGTYSSACTAAAAFGKVVRVIDSGTVSCGVHLLTDEAVNLIVGGATLAEVCERMLELRNRIGMVFTVESLEPLKRGGRLVYGGAVGTASDTRPILTQADGIRLVSYVRAGKACVKALLSFLPDNIRRIFITYSAGADYAELQAALEKRFPHVKVRVRDVGPVISAHVGSGAMGVAYICPRNPQIRTPNA